MSDTVQCPACGAVQRDLWDHEWGSRECITATCDECGEDYALSRHVTVRYEAEPLKASP